MTVSITGTDPGSYVPDIAAPVPGAPVRAEDIQIVAQGLANQTKHGDNVVTDGTYQIRCLSVVAGASGLASGIGVTATGGPGSAGIKGTGGTGGGVGVDAIGTSNAPGITSLGNGSGAGIIATGGSSGGTGVKAVAGSGGIGIECGAGNMKFTGTQPAKTADVGVNNYLSATNVPKAWGSINLPLGVPSILDGYNVASAVLTGVNTVTVTLARAMANTSYAPIVSVAASNVGANIVPLYAVLVSSATVFSVTFYSDSTTLKDITGINLVLFFSLFGRQ